MTCLMTNQRSLFDVLGSGGNQMGAQICTLHDVSAQPSAAGSPRRPGAQRSRPCAACRTRDKIPVVCTRTPPASRARSQHSARAEIRAPVCRIRERPRTRLNALSTAGRLSVMIPTPPSTVSTSMFSYCAWAMTVISIFAMRNGSVGGGRIENKLRETRRPALR